MRICPLIWAAAFAAALAACSHPAQRMLSAAHAREAYEVGRRLAAQDRERTEQHRKEIARLIRVTASKTREADRTISLYLQLHNLSAKRIASVEAGLEVHDARGHRIGLTEIKLDRAIAAHGSVAFWYPLRYLRFGEDAGTMRLAAGKRKSVRMDVTEIRYADGSDAGYDD